MTNIKQNKFYDVLRRGFKGSPLNVIRYYLFAQYRSLFDQNEFNDLRTYCLFIGHGRSGHSIVGALLDAHKNAIVADEIDTLRYLSAGFNKRQICHILLAHSEKLATRQRTKAGRAGKTYSYSVPGQWQGRFSRLQVIGDSKAAQSARRLIKNPELLAKLGQTMGTEVKVIHIVRNPYDNISTLALKNYASLNEAMDRFFSDCDAVESVRNEISPIGMIEKRHEDLIQHPEATLIELCNFIGLEPEESYFNACASIIYKNPAKSRLKVEWNTQSIKDVKRRMEKYEFLAGYSYEN